MYSVRQMDVDDKVSQHVTMDIFAHIYAPETIEKLLQKQRAQEPKERRLRDVVPRSIVFFVLAMALWTRLSQARVWEKLTHKLQVVHPAGPVISLTAAALSYQRGLLGVEPLRGLLEQCCHPLCEQQTPGAFYRNYRIMAIDGSVFSAPDTKANEQAFGRSSNQYGKGAYPQVRCVFLLECGSHATIQLSVQPYHRSEVHGAHELLPTLQADMLVTHDSGLFGGGLWEAIRGKGAHSLCALASTVLTHRAYTLKDGSYLAWLHPSKGAAYPMQKSMLIRVIEYRVTDERLGEPGKVYRLATTWLNAHTAPAMELILLYHERWEIELALDEIKTHQRQQQKVLRSKTPEGVRQELYATVLAHYAVRSLMVQAASQAKVDPDRLSFTAALFQVQEAIDDGMTFAPEHGPRLLVGLLARLAKAILPPRRLRVNRRELKQVYKKYKPKKRHVPPPAPFRPDERFEDFVELVA